MPSPATRAVRSCWAIPGAERSEPATASPIRSRVAAGSEPRRSSPRKRTYPRRAAAEPASTPRKLGSCPADDCRPLRIGSDASGAVRSSWMGKRLIGVLFGMATTGVRTFLRSVSIGSIGRPSQGARARYIAVRIAMTIKTSPSANAHIAVRGDGRDLAGQVLVLADPDRATAVRGSAARLAAALVATGGRVAGRAPLGVLTGEAALARDVRGPGEAVARHVREHVVADAPIGHGATPGAGPRLLVLVVVDIVPRGAGVVV